ncbi:MAG: cytochrome P460 family protein [Gemmatimonadales bacterium]
MKHINKRVLASLFAIAAVAACGGETAEQDEPAPDTTASTQAAPDTTGAAMWAYLQEADYRNNWQLWPEKGELYTGSDPHGALLTTYVNDVAYEAITTRAGAMPAGAIVVKENYMAGDSSLGAVTTMFKVEGYNAEHNDWFFTKHLPSGELDQAPNGMALEGRLPGCQSCHIAQAANDYVFTSSLQPED